MAKTLQDKIDELLGRLEMSGSGGGVMSQLDTPANAVQDAHRERYLMDMFSGTNPDTGESFLEPAETEYMKKRSSAILENDLKKSALLEKYTATEGTLQNIGQLDLSDNVANRFSNHDSYNTGMAGAPVGRFKQDLHLLDLVTDIRNNAGEVITRDNITPQNIRKLQMMTPPTGVITHDLLMGLEKQGLL